MDPHRVSRVPRFALLLGATLLEIVLSPILLSTQAGRLPSHLVTAGLLLAALTAAGLSRRTLALFMVAGIGLMGSALSSSTWLEALAAGFRALFFGSVLAVLVRYALAKRDVTFDTIAAASCAYLLIGLVWSDFYLLADMAFPGSFEIPASLLVGGPGSRRTAFLYFSYETLTTVAYGDVHPTHPGAGGLAVSEAIVGQLYLAIMITRMVALQLAARHGPQGPAEP
ncbi:MAG: ion channel [Myxococcota bacterium]